MLSNFDFQKLSEYVGAGDRIAYYDYLYEKGDSYAMLANSVVQNSLFAGAVANAFVSTVAFEKTGRILSNEELVQISVALMTADFNARQQAANNGGVIGRVEIANYHISVFQSFGLPPDVWTAYRPLVLAETEQAADALWASLLDPKFYELSNFVEQVLFIVGNKLVDPVIGGDWNNNIVEAIMVASTTGLGSNAYGGFRVSFGFGEIIGGTQYSDTGVGRLIGTGGNDVIMTFDGGKNEADGGAGDDRIHGGFYNDTLSGGLGRDILMGKNGEDALVGSYRDFTGLQKGPFDNDADFLDGGMGLDTYYVGAEYSSLTQDERTVSFFPFDEFNRNIYEYIDVIKDIDGRGAIHVSAKLKNHNTPFYDGIYRSNLELVANYSYGGLPLYQDPTNASYFSAVADQFVDGTTGKTIYRLIFLDGAAGDAIFALEDFRSGDFGITVQGYDRREGTGGNDRALNDGGNGGGLLRAAFSASSSSDSTSTYNDITLDSPSSSDQRIHMGAGDDLAYGRGGADDVRGEDGNDTLYGGEDADNVEGGAGDDVLYGDEGNDTLEGGIGDDILTGGSGSDIYLFGVGDGNDTIEDWNDPASTDTLSLGSGISAAAVSVARGVAGFWDVLLGFGTAGSVTIRSGFDALVTVIEQIKFDDGTVWDMADLREKFLTQAITSGNDTIYGFYGIDDAISGGGGNDTIDGFSGNDMLFGEAGDDVLVGEEGNDTLTGGAGGDTLVGNSGSDIYVYASGDGYDYLNDDNNGSGDLDVLRLTALDQSDVEFMRSGLSLIMTVLATGETIFVNNQFKPDQGGYWGIEKVEFADGSSWDLVRISDIGWIRGTTGNDTLTGTWRQEVLAGGADDDNLNGDWGADTYVFNSGDGNDTIQDWGNPESLDVVQLGAGISAGVVSVERGATGFWDVVLDFGTSGSVTIVNGFYDASSVVEQVRFDDHTVWTRNDLQSIYLAQSATSAGDTIFGFIGRDDVMQGGAGNDSLTSFSGNDTLLGGEGDDSLSGDDGNDILEGGAGNDGITGGLGNDTYVFKPGFGTDWVADFTAGAGTDDVLEISNSVFADFQSILQSAWQNGADTMIGADSNNVIMLHNVAVNSLHADDFRFVA